jgi:hypothetical protein
MMEYITPSQGAALVEQINHQGQSIVVRIMTSVLNNVYYLATVYWFIREVILNYSYLCFLESL